MGNTAPKGWYWKPGTEFMHDGYTMDNVLIIHVAANNGFENTSTTGNGTFALSSARHETRVLVNQGLTVRGVI